MIRVIEVTKENEEKYIDQIAALEVEVLEHMERNGRVGQLFITGKEDISEYVNSEENSVFVVLGDNDNVIAATYITQGQKPFTYNDITKYFKTGKVYDKHVRDGYEKISQYRNDLLDIYKIKLQAFEYAKGKVLTEYPEVKSISEFLESEVQENGFHEKSELREKLNAYMSEYIIGNFGEDTQAKYEKFYWVTSEKISEEFGKKIVNLSESEQEYEKFIELQSEYDEIMQKSEMPIYEEPKFDMSKYFSANTQNAIEIDTYITDPNNRSAGLARILVYEGIKEHMQKHFSKPTNKEIFLCSTLHRDNLPSKYVSEFFGLTDNLYVKRRQGRNREVHICRIPREKYTEYLESMEDKLAVLYGYNPNNKEITDETRMKVLEEQLKYEKKQYAKLKRAKTKGKLAGINLTNIPSKFKKIQGFKKQIKNLTRSERDVR